MAKKSIIPDSLEDWLIQKVVDIGTPLVKLANGKQRKLRKLEIDIERVSRYVRTDLALSPDVYKEKLNRRSRLQAQYMQITGHYYKLAEERIRVYNDSGVVA